LKKGNRLENIPADHERIDSITGRKRKRVTLIVYEMLDKNIELFAVATNRTKTEIVEEALADYLRKRNINPCQDQSARVYEWLLNPKSK